MLLFQWYWSKRIDRVLRNIGILWIENKSIRKNPLKEEEKKKLYEKKQSKFHNLFDFFIIKTFLIKSSHDINIDGAK